MSIYEQRVLLRVMEHCSAQLHGIRIADNLRKLEITPVTYELTMPVTDAFPDDFTVQETQDVLMVLARRMFQYEDAKVWWACGYIEHPKVIKGTGMMTFGIYKPFWDVLLNFVSGFREIELNKALLLPTTYSLRFYMLMSGKTNPLYMSIEDLKQWLGIENTKYKDKNGKHRIDHLEERVIRPAQKALNESCPYTFTYTKKRLNDKNSKSPVIGFTFTSVYQPKFRDPDLEKKSLVSKVTPRFLVGENVYRYLKDNFGYTQETLNIHKQIINRWYEQETDPMQWLALKKRAAAESSHGPIAYICGAMKHRAEELVKAKAIPALPFEDIETNVETETVHADIDSIATILTEKFKM